MNTFIRIGTLPILLFLGLAIGCDKREKLVPSSQTEVTATTQTEDSTQQKTNVKVEIAPTNLPRSHLINGQKDPNASARGIYETTSSVLSQNTSTSALAANTYFDGTKFFEADSALLAEFRSGTNIIGLHGIIEDRLPDFIWLGMTKDEIRVRLGPPRGKSQSDMAWSYTLYYSMVLDVTFGENGRVSRLFAPGITN